MVGPACRLEANKPCSACRCCASGTRQNDMQCVKIEQNWDNTTTYRFSELGSPLVREHLEAQLAATPAEEELLAEAGRSASESSDGRPSNGNGSQSNGSGGGSHTGSQPPGASEVEHLHLQTSLAARSREIHQPLESLTPHSSRGRSGGLQLPNNGSDHVLEHARGGNGSSLLLAWAGLPETMHDTSTSRSVALNFLCRSSELPNQLQAVVNAR